MQMECQKQLAKAKDTETFDNERDRYIRNYILGIGARKGPPGRKTRQ